MLYTCSYCKSVSPIGIKYKLCSACKISMYCSKECQTAHWKIHKDRCGVDKHAPYIRKFTKVMSECNRYLTPIHLSIFMESRTGRCSLLVFDTLEEFTHCCDNLQERLSHGDIDFLHKHLCNSEPSESMKEEMSSTPNRHTLFIKIQDKVSISGIIEMNHSYRIGYMQGVDLTPSKAKKWIETGIDTPARIFGEKIILNDYRARIAWTKRILEIAMSHYGSTRQDISTIVHKIITNGNIVYPSLDEELERYKQGNPITIQAGEYVFLLE